MLNTWLTFHGHTLVPTPPHHKDPGSQSLTVLCGDNPPKITDGYAKWNVVDRPLRRGLTIFQGYSPAVMQCEVRFGTWPNDLSCWPQKDGDMGAGGRRPIDVEKDISLMEAWAGSSLTSGVPSFVQVVAYRQDSSTAVQTNLIPSRYHTQNGKPFVWIITGMDWGESTRNADGDRIRQDVTVTLTNYLNFQAPKPIVDQWVPASYFRTTKRYNTPLKIVSDRVVHAASPTRNDLAYRIIRDSKNKHLKLHRINQVIKPNTRVWVPRHIRG